VVGHIFFKKSSIESHFVPQLALLLSLPRVSSFLQDGLPIKLGQYANNKALASKQYIGAFISLVELGVDWGTT
jgi:hypothetical protein